MTIGENLTTFDGKPVVDFQQGNSLSPEKNAYRLRREYGADYTFGDLVADFLSRDSVEQVTSIVTGAYSDEMYDESESMAGVVEVIVAAADQFPNLSGLFLADLTFEELEISWIQQSDISPVWDAFPRLRTLGVRGGENLSLGTIVHDQLRSLTVQTGGLDTGVIAQVINAKLPELDHLELWLGEDNYGGNSELADILPLIDSSTFPKIKYLGMKNSTYQDDIAKAVIDSSVLAQLDVLDLSMGILTDEGADALLAHGDRLAHLKTLNLSHHFLSPEMVERLSSLACDVDVSDPQEADVDGDEVYRYIAVGE